MDVIDLFFQRLPVVDIFAAVPFISVLIDEFLALSGFPSKGSDYGDAGVFPDGHVEAPHGGNPVADIPVVFHEIAPAFL